MTSSPLRSASGPNARTQACSSPVTVASAGRRRARRRPARRRRRAARRGRRPARRRRPSTATVPWTTGPTGRPGRAAQDRADVDALAGARRAPGPLVAPARERADDRQQVARALGQLVVDPRRDLAVALAGQEAVGDHAVQPRAQLLGGDPRQDPLQLDEAAGAAGEVADDEQGPLVTHEIEGARVGRPLVVGVPFLGRWEQGFPARTSYRPESRARTAPDRTCFCDVRSAVLALDGQRFHAPGGGTSTARSSRPLRSSWAWAISLPFRPRVDALHAAPALFSLRARVAVDVPRRGARRPRVRRTPLAARDRTRPRRAPSPAGPSARWSSGARRSLGLPLVWPEGDAERPGRDADRRARGRARARRGLRAGRRAPGLLRRLRPRRPRGPGRGRGGRRPGARRGAWPRPATPARTAWPATRGSASPAWAPPPCRCCSSAPSSSAASTASRRRARPRAGAAPGAPSSCDADAARPAPDGLPPARWRALRALGGRRPVRAELPGRPGRARAAQALRRRELPWDRFVADPGRGRGADDDRDRRRVDRRPAAGCAPRGPGCRATARPARRVAAWRALAGLPLDFVALRPRLAGRA